jgi:hypothetical protein
VSGVTQIDVDVGGDTDWLPVAHLDALVPGGVGAQDLGDRLDLGGERGADLLGFIAVEDAPALCNRWCAPPASRPPRGCSCRGSDHLPMTRDSAVVHFCGMLGDDDHVGDLVAALPGAGAGVAAPVRSGHSGSGRGATRRVTGHRAIGRSSRQTPASLRSSGIGGATCRRFARANSACGDLPSRGGAAAG